MCKNSTKNPASSSRDAQRGALIPLPETSRETSSPSHPIQSTSAWSATSEEYEQHSDRVEEHGTSAWSATSEEYEQYTDRVEEHGCLGLNQAVPPKRCSSSNETFRLSTFRNYPASSTVDLVEVSRHGHFYTAFKARTQCFSCGAIKEHWSSQDDPSLSRWHLRSCELILGTETSNVPIGNRFPEFDETVISPTELSLNTFPRASPGGAADGISAPQRDEGAHSCCFLDDTMVMERERRDIPLNGVVLTLTEPADPSPEEKLRLEIEFPCLYPVNPHMRDYEARLQTFDQKWPGYKVLATKEHIAKAGFFFLGDGDRAKCWCCNGGLQNWDPNDEPFTEHAKWFPGCEYMLRCKGVDFVRNLVQQFPNLKRPTLRRPRFDHRTKQLINSAPVVPRGQIPYRSPRTTISAGALLQNYDRSSPEVRSSMITENPSLTSNLNPSRRVDFSELQTRAVEVGIAKERTEHGIQMIRDGERRFRDENEFFNFLMEQQPPQPNPHIQEIVQCSAHGRNAILVHEAAQKRNNDMEVNEEKLSGEGTNGETPSKMSKTEDRVELSKELEELEKERKCKNCFKRQAETVIIPCGHLALCSVCSPSAKMCGVCRTKIVNCIQVFLS